MAIRVDREVFDPASGHAPGGVQIFDDGTRQSAWQPRPFTTKVEYQVSQALERMAVPADAIRALRPPVPQQLFPPQFGYDQTPLTIYDVLDTNRWSPMVRSWTSGTPVVPRRVDQTEDMWSGTLRNFDSSPNRTG